MQLSDDTVIAFEEQYEPVHASTVTAQSIGHKTPLTCLFEPYELR